MQTLLCHVCHHNTCTEELLMVGADNTAYLAVLAFEYWTTGSMQACLATLVKSKYLCAGALSLTKAGTSWAPRIFHNFQCVLVGLLHSEHT